MSSDFSKRMLEARYAMYPGETWEQIAKRVVNNVYSITKNYSLTGFGRKYLENLQEETIAAIINRKFVPAGRYLYATGREVHNVNNCLALRVEDSREGWGNFFYRSAMALQLGAGIGANFSAVRAEGELIKKTGGVASGVLSLLRMINAMGNEIKQGGFRRAAIMALLSIRHPEILKFIKSKEQDGHLSCVNISVLINTNEYMPESVLSEIFSRMYENGEPGLMNIAANPEEDLTNPCGEMRASKDSTMCSLGSINMGNVTDVEEMRRLRRLGAYFLVLGSLYSDKPYQKCKKVLDEDRRIGLGLMGVAEFLYKRNLPYAPSAELQDYLDVYAETTVIANELTDMLEISPVTYSRAVAPNGTTSIVTGTTGGIEPPFARIYKRQYYDQNGTIQSEVIEDFICKRLEEKGLNFKTAYDIPLEDRLGLQAQIQASVDMAVSSTINFRQEDYSKDLLRNKIMEYLPRLKGITVYPLNSRADAPIQILDDCKSGFCSS